MKKKYSLVRPLFGIVAYPGLITCNKQRQYAPVSSFHWIYDRLSVIMGPSSYLFNEIGMKPPTELGKFIVKLNEASIPTRYPENLANLQKFYNEVAVKDILINGRKVIKWINRQL